MAGKGQLYKCDICGNVVEIKQAGEGMLVCCGEAMRLLSPEEAEIY